MTGLVDLEQGRLLEVVADRTRAAVDRWLGARPRGWLAQVSTVALDPWRGYASALVVPLGHVTVVVDHFHAIRLANLGGRSGSSADPAGDPGQSRGLHQLPEHACRWNLAAAT